MFAWEGSPLRRAYPPPGAVLSALLLIVPSFVKIPELKGEHCVLLPLLYVKKESERNHIKKTGLPLGKPVFETESFSIGIVTFVPHAPGTRLWLLLRRSGGAVPQYRY